MKKPTFECLFLILVIVQAMHSAEEILFRLNDWLPSITKRISYLYDMFPVLQMGESTFIVLNILVVLIFVFIAINLLRHRKWAYQSAIVVGAIELVNGLMHLSAVMIFGKYFPGCITAVLLVFVATWFLNIKNSRNLLTAAE